MSADGGNGWNDSRCERARGVGRLERLPRCMLRGDSIRRTTPFRHPTERAYAR